MNQFADERRQNEQHQGIIRPVQRMDDAPGSLPAGSRVEALIQQVRQQQGRQADINLEFRGNLGPQDLARFNITYDEANRRFVAERYDFGDRRIGRANLNLNNHTDKVVVDITGTSPGETLTIQIIDKPLESGVRKSELITVGPDGVASKREGRAVYPELEECVAVEDDLKTWRKELNLLKPGDTFQSVSGRAFFKREDGSLFYNSTPKQDNTWGRVGDEHFYILQDRQMILVEPKVTSPAKNPTRYFVDADNNVYAENGERVKPTDGSYRLPKPNASTVPVARVQAEDLDYLAENDVARFMLKPEALEPQTPGRAEAQIPGAELLGEIEFKMKVQDLAGLRSMGMRFEAHPVTGMPGLTFGKDLDVRGRINQGELRGIGALRLDKHTAKVELQELDNGYQLIVTDKPVGSRPPVETTVTIEAPAYTIENTAYRERTLRIAKKDGELWGLMNEATQEGLRVEQATGSARSEDYYRIVDQRGAVISSFKFDIWKDKSRAAVISEALTQLLARRALERQRQQE